jgi:hypothetical protein
MIKTLEIAPAEVRNFEEEFKQIQVSSLAALVIKSSGAELEDFSKDSIASLADSMDNSVIGVVETSYDKRFMQKHEEFLKMRAYNDDCGDEDLSFLKG